MCLSLASLLFGLSYADWHQVCQQFKTEWEIVGRALKDLPITVGRINFNDEGALTAKFDATTLPTFKLYFPPPKDP